MKIYLCRSNDKKETKGIEFKINKDKITFERDYLNAERNRKGK